MEKNKNKSRSNMGKVKEKVLRTEIDSWIQKFLEYLSVEQNCSELTILNYKHYLDRLSDWFNINYPYKKLCDLDLEAIKRYREFLADYMDIKGIPLKRITQVYHLISLRSFLRFLEKNKVKALSAEKIELPKKEENVIKFLNAEQIEKLLHSPPISKLADLRDKAILELLFSTGLSVSELVKLNKDQINLSRKEFGVIGHGGRPRVVFLSLRAMKWLKEYLKKRNDDLSPLFVRFSGKVDKSNHGEKMRLSIRSVQRIVSKYAKKAKLTIKITPQGLRHSFATDLISRGADIRSVQEMLGHKNITTTQIYTSIANAKIREIHKKFHSGNQN